MKKDHHPWVIAHRGARNEAPENTGTALARAMTYAIEGVEFDVQMTSDGVPVLYHDNTLYKVSGSRKKIADLTLTQLEAIDWGAWFHTRFANEPPATLDRAMTIVRDCPNICIEIKSTPDDRASGHVFRLTEKVVALLNQPEIQGYKDHALILSFDPDVLVRAHDMDNDLRCVLNLPERDPINATAATDHLWAVDARVSQLSPSLAQWARGRDLRLFTYTCNGPRQVKKAIRIGVDAIITDRPGWLIRQLDQS